MNPPPGTVFVRGQKNGLWRNYDQLKAGLDVDANIISVSWKNSFTKHGKALPVYNVYQMAHIPYPTTHKKKHVVHFDILSPVHRTSG